MSVVGTTRQVYYRYAKGNPSRSSGKVAVMQNAEELRVDPTTLLDAFESHIVDERGLSRETGKMYRYRVEHACRLDGRYRSRNNPSVKGPELPAIHPLDVEVTDLKRYLLERCPKAGTKATARKAFRSFYGWLVEEGYREDNPALSLKRPKVPNSLPKYLSQEEADKLSEAAYWEGVSEHALMQTYRYAGVRLTEGRSLAWQWPSSAQDPDGVCSGIVELGNEPFLWVRGKGEKERTVPMHPKLAEALRKLHKYRRSEVWLFPRHDGSGPLPNATIYRMVKRWARQVGIDESKVSPHKLRHTFATALLARGPTSLMCRRRWDTLTSAPR
jgi:integrase/recombinase XerD